MYMYVCTYMVCYIYPRIHAGIDEMDVFINIDLNTFLDVRYVHCKNLCSLLTHIHVYIMYAHKNNDIPSFMGACKSNLNLSYLHT